MTLEQAEAARIRFAAGETQTAIAAEYGVSQAAMSKVILGKTHKGPRVYVTREHVLRRQKASRFMREYGITLDEWEAMLEASEHRCEICRKHVGEMPPHPQTDRSFLVCDHDHATGKVRGVLCNNCNAGLGFAEDSIERLEEMIKYLKKHGGKAF